VETIRQKSGGRVEVLALADCLHSPQRDQPEAVLSAITRFVSGIAGLKAEPNGV